MNKSSPLDSPFRPRNLPVTASESKARRCIVQSVIAQVARDGGKVPQSLLVLLERYVHGELDFASSR